MDCLYLCSLMTFNVSYIIVATCCTLPGLLSVCGEVEFMLFFQLLKAMIMVLEEQDPCEAMDLVVQKIFNIV